MALLRETSVLFQVNSFCLLWGQITSTQRLRTWPTHANEVVLLHAI